MHDVKGHGMRVFSVHTSCPAPKVVKLTFLCSHYVIKLTFTTYDLWAQTSRWHMKAEPKFVALLEVSSIRWDFKQSRHLLIKLMKKDGSKVQWSLLVMCNCTVNFFLHNYTCGCRHVLAAFPKSGPPHAWSPGAVADPGRLRAPACSSSDRIGPRTDVPLFTFAFLAASCSRPWGGRWQYPGSSSPDHSSRPKSPVAIQCDQCEEDWGNQLLFGVNSACHYNGVCHNLCTHCCCIFYFTTVTAPRMYFVCCKALWGGRGPLWLYKWCCLY